MADPTGSQPTPGVPAANGTDPNATPAPAVPVATPPTPAQAPPPEPTSAATRAGSTDYRQRTLRHIEAYGLPVVKDAKGNPSVRLSLEAVSLALKEAKEQAASGANLSEAERARIATLEANNAELRKTAETAVAEKTTYIMRQKVASAISGKEAPGALDHAVSAFIAEYETVEDPSLGTFYRHAGQVMVNAATGLPMTLADVTSHMLARYPYLAKPGAAPGVTPVGQTAVNDGDLAAQIAAATDPSLKYALGKKMRDQLKR